MTRVDATSSRWGDDDVADDDLATNLMVDLDAVGITGLALVPEGLRHLFRCDGSSLTPASLRGANSDALAGLTDHQRSVLQEASSATRDWAVEGNPTVSEQAATWCEDGAGGTARVARRGWHGAGGMVHAPPPGRRPAGLPRQHLAQQRTAQLTLRHEPEHRRFAQAIAVRRGGAARHQSHRRAL